VSPLVSLRDFFSFPFRAHNFPFLIFSSYTGITSIFILIDTAIGRHYVNADVTVEGLANAQVAATLGIGAMGIGIIPRLKNRSPALLIKTFEWIPLSIALGYISLALSIGFSFIPAIAQLGVRFGSLSVVSLVVGGCYAWNCKRMIFVWIALPGISLGLFKALHSGMKEPVIFPLLLALLLFIQARRYYLAGGFVVTLGIVTLLAPAFTQTFRDNAWRMGLSTDEALEVAMDSGMSGTEVANSFNEFLVDRCSEIHMLSKYIQFSRSDSSFRGFEIPQGALGAILPRFLLSSKRSSEELAMERAYLAGVYNRGSSGSAKPMPIADGYMMGGYIGIFIYLFILGTIWKLLGIYAERNIGGYMVGVSTIFAGLFYQFWRGNCIEFLANGFFWGAALLFSGSWTLKMIASYMPNLIARHQKFRMNKKPAKIQIPLGKRNTY